MVVSAEVQELDKSSEEYSIVTVWPEGARTAKVKLVVAEEAFVRTGATGGALPVLKKPLSDMESPAGFEPETFQKMVELAVKAGVGVHVRTVFPTLQ